MGCPALPAELEARVLSVPKYQDFCQLVYPNHTKISTTGACARATSALYFFDPDYFKPAHTSYSPASPPLCPQVRLLRVLTWGLCRCHCVFCVFGAVDGCSAPASRLGADV